MYFGNKQSWNQWIKDFMFKKLINLCTRKLIDPYLKSGY